MTSLIRRNARSSTAFGRRSLLAGTGVVGAAIALASCSSNDSSSDATPSPSDSASAEATDSAEQDMGPVGKEADDTEEFAEDRPYLALAPDSDGPLVELFVDYRCPHCKVFSDVNGEYIEKAVKDGKFKYRVYPRPMLDAATGTSFSTDTASAAVAAYAQDPELYWDMERAMFDLQPKTKDDPTPDTKEIAEAAEKAGLDKDGVSKVTDGEYKKYVDSVEEIGRKLDIGTPVVYINGTAWEGDHEIDGELQKAIEDAS